jgi:hypothetical protein
MRGLRKRTQHVGDLVEPAALFPGGGEDFAERGPEPQRTVPDREGWGAHAAAGAIAQQIGPGLGRFPVSVGQRDQLLPAVRAHADHHQQAEFVLLEADVDVDAIRPQVHVVHVRQIPGGERSLLGLPGLGQRGDHRPGQAGRRAQELPEGGHEIPR